MALELGLTEKEFLTMTGLSIDIKGSINLSKNVIYAGSELDFVTNMNNLC